MFPMIYLYGYMLVQVVENYRMHPIWLETAMNETVSENCGTTRHGTTYV